MFSSFPFFSVSRIQFPAKSPHVWIITITYVFLWQERRFTPAASPQGQFLYEINTGLDTFKYIYTPYPPNPHILFPFTFISQTPVINIYFEQLLGLLLYKHYEKNSGPYRILMHFIPIFVNKIKQSKYGY